MGEMERGAKGMLPLGCFPRWGRVGVTLIAFSKCKKIWAATGFLQSSFLVLHCCQHFRTVFFSYNQPESISHLIPEKERPL